MSCEWELTLKSYWYEFKRRGAILPAGHFANWAFCIAKRVPLSLVLYGKQLPDWVQNLMMKSITCHTLIRLGLV
jgi:hypothetical protein